MKERQDETEDVRLRASHGFTGTRLVNRLDT